MSNTPPFPKDMPHIGLIPGEIDSDITAPTRRYEDDGTDRAAVSSSSETAASDPLNFFHETIRRNPGSAVLIALGAGILFGLTTRR